MDCKHLCILVFVTFVYMAIGTFLFSHLEIDRETENHHLLSKKIDSFLGNHTCMTMRDLLYFFDTIETQSKQGRSIALRIIVNTTRQNSWDYTGSLSYVVTLLTTIGYGHLVPDTTASKIISVFYALFGIPLTLVMLKELGGKLNHASKCLYKVKICERAWLNKLVGVTIVFLLGITLVMILPSLMFSHFENWSMVESLYYSFITLSTVGFGDYVPVGYSLENSSFYRPYLVIIYIWVLIGLVHVSLLISSISNAMVNNARLVEKHTVSKLEVEMKRLKEEISRHRRKTCSFIKHSDGRTNVTQKKATLLRFNSLEVVSDSSERDVTNKWDTSSGPNGIERRYEITEVIADDDSSIRINRIHNDSLLLRETTEMSENGVSNRTIGNNNERKTHTDGQELEEEDRHCSVIENCHGEKPEANALSKGETSTKNNGKFTSNYAKEKRDEENTAIVLNPCNLVNIEIGS